MGNIYTAKCSKCNYTKELNIGSGMGSIRADVVSKVLLTEDLEEWNRLHDNERISFFMWEYEQAYCQNCNELQSVFTVKVQTKDGDELRLGRRCNLCHSKVKAISVESDVICPECKKAVLVYEKSGMWD